MSDVDLDTWPEDAASVRHEEEPDASGDERRGDLLVFPRLSGRLVTRSRHQRRLDRLAPVTVVEALPGFGKTTTVASWARAREAAGDRVVWLRAVEEVDDPAALLDLVRRALVRSGLALSPTTPSAARRPSWSDGLARADRPVLLVVDDAHRLRDPRIADDLVRLVGAAPSLHLTVVCEPGHRFGEAATRRATEVNLLRGSDLAVAPDEVVDLAEAWGHALTPEAARSLHRVVGGWPLLLRLVLDDTPSWAEELATGGAEHVLAARVLPALASSGVLGVATRYAVPERLDLDLAGALRTDASGQAALADLALLERLGLLWQSSRRDGRPVLRYPELVRRSLLDASARADPDAARSAHRLVARALSGGLGPARSGALLRHARAAGDWDLLAQLWTERGWSLAGADPDSFERAYGAVPAEVRQRHPELTVAVALSDALAATHDIEWTARTEALLQHYTQVGSDAARRRDQLTSPTLLAEVLTAAMVARRTEGRLAEAQELAGEVARELDRARQLEPTRLHSSQVAWFHVQDAVTRLHAGDYGGALAAATRAHQVGPGDVVGAGAAALVAAMHAVSGQPDDALQWLRRHEAVDTTGHWASHLAEVPARLARATLALDRLDGRTAAAELAEVPTGSELSGLWPLVVIAQVHHALLFGDPAAMLFQLEHLRQVRTRHLVDPGRLAAQVFERCTAELLLALGEVNRLEPRLARDADLPPWLSAPAARFHLMTGDPGRAARVAAAGTWRDDVHARDRTDLLMTAAVAWHVLGESARAQEGFRRAHAASVAAGNRQVWLHLPDDLREDLLRDTGLALDPEVATGLAEVRRVYPERVDLVRLSQRELEVLRQIPHHDTAAGVARTLSVSTNTVKKQMISVYGKLGVHDRDAALLRAQRLGLIDADAGRDRSRR